MTMGLQVVSILGKKINDIKKFADKLPVIIDLNLGLRIVVRNVINSFELVVRLSCFVAIVAC